MKPTDQEIQWEKYFPLPTQYKSRRTRNKFDEGRYGHHLRQRLGKFEILHLLGCLACYTQNMDFFEVSLALG